MHFQHKHLSIDDEDLAQRKSRQTVRRSLSTPSDGFVSDQASKQPKRENHEIQQAPTPVGLTTRTTASAARRRAALNLLPKVSKLAKIG